MAKIVIAPAGDERKEDVRGKLSDIEVDILAQMLEESDGNWRAVAARFEVPVAGRA